jgi:hypothetical protein
MTRPRSKPVISAARQRKTGAKGKPRGKPFKPGNPWRWTQGESGNPAGYEPSLLLGAAYRKLLGQPFPADAKPATIRAALASLITDGASWADVIAFGQLAEAAKGRTFAAIEIRQATEGSKLSGPDGGAIPIKVTSDDMVKGKKLAQDFEQQLMRDASKASARRAAVDGK